MNCVDMKKDRKTIRRYIVMLIDSYEKSNMHFHRIEPLDIHLLKLYFGIEGIRYTEENAAEEVGIKVSRVRKAIENTLDRLEREFTIETYRNNLYESPIVCLRLSHYLIRNLENKGIKTIQDLVRTDKHTLLRVQGIGPITIRQIKEDLVWLGIDFKISPQDYYDYNRYRKN